ncbi:hypothetical protein D9Q98_004984 [Chlorella vulgaris]|uniref:Uncharacterized protein n=1 Tax=Chlorella vulgaris TaxID=3077 RepID=A0A9D4TNN7_CHLVU|nr:hypothetical protein D9Q98_004984 [Chlorella vulgaris]
MSQSPTKTDCMQLKRLEPVATSAAAVSAKAGSIYAFVRHYVPTRIEGTVGQAEGKAASLASPYVALLSNKAATALAAVDSKADSAILCAWRSYATNTARLGSVVEGQKAARASDLEQLAEARRVYLKRVEESVAFVREQGVHGTTKAAAEALASKVQEARRVPEMLVHEISAAWTKLSAVPTVERLLAGSKVQVDAALTRYQATHNAVVADPRYGAALAKGSELLGSLQSTGLYQAAVTRLSPLLDMPVTQSAAKAAAPYLNAVTVHLAPAAGQPAPVAA